MDLGTIRRKETKKVFADVLNRRKVPRSVWCVKGARLEFLVGSELIIMPCHANMSYWVLTEAVRKLEGHIDDYFRQKEHKGQLDLVDAVRQS